MYPKYAQRSRKPADLLLVPMIDIFTVLVTFLLMTAVFSRIAIVQLDLPSAAAGKPAEPTFRLEVIVRKTGFVLTNGRAKIGALPKVNGKYDFKGLAAAALSLKRKHPRADNASVLLAPTVPYNALIHVTDAIRSAVVPLAETDGLVAAAPAGTDTVIANAQGGLQQTTRISLFNKIAVGDAP